MNKKTIRDMQDPIRMLEFGQLIEYYTLFDHEVLELLEVYKRTFNKWKLNNSAPNWERKLVVIHGRGYLPADAEWHEFSLRTAFYTLHLNDLN